MKALDRCGRRLALGLNRIDASLNYEITLRIYHGWHKGFEPTDNKKALITASSSIDFASLSCRKNVNIRPELEYGDRLISALDGRLHSKLAIHLPNTLRTAIDRRQYSSSTCEEKMVDTALVADVVDLAHRDRKAWLIIMSEDDDIVPALFVAEAARRPVDGRIVLMRKRLEGSFFSLTNLLVHCE